MIANANRQPRFQSDRPEEFDGSHVLAKAANDTYTYLVGLRCGLTIVCSNLKQNGAFLHLEGIDSVCWPDGSVPGADVQIGFSRGMDVRLSEIAFAVDQDS